MVTYWQAMTRTLEGDNYHTARDFAVQLAQELFADRIAADNSTLESQLRKTIAQVVKNAYITQLIVDFHNSQDPEKYTFVRTGSIAYVGAGESKENVLNEASGSVKQIKEALRAHGITVVARYRILHSEKN